MRILLIIIGMFLVTGCETLSNGLKWAIGDSLVPTLYDLPDMVPENAPDEWKLAWKQGCESGLSAYGGLFHKSLYEFHQDVNLMRNPTYAKGWTDAFNYCRAYINRYLAGEGFTKGPPTVLSTHNLKLKPRDLRDPQAVKEFGFGVGAEGWSLWGGIVTPGWGDTAWGANVDSSDWLGRESDNSPDWLGRTGKFKSDSIY